MNGFDAGETTITSIAHPSVGESSSTKSTTDKIAAEACEWAAFLGSDAHSGDMRPPRPGVHYSINFADPSTCIGAGNNASVWQAHDVHSHDAVAVKVSNTSALCAVLGGTMEMSTSARHSGCGIDTVQSCVHASYRSAHSTRPTACCMPLASLLALCSWGSSLLHSSVELQGDACVKCSMCAPGVAALMSYVIPTDKASCGRGAVQRTQRYALHLRQCR